MANVEAGPETSVFRSWGPLGRVDTAGNRIDYAVPVEPDGDPHQNGFHSNGINGVGVNTELLTSDRA